ncbi:MAG: hypothetical protein Q9174_007006 [Haloplaca sp. 1 TL-2023]
MFPLDGTLGPTMSGVGAPIDPMNVNGNNTNQNSSMDFASTGFEGGNSGLPNLNTPMASLSSDLQNYPPIDPTQQFGTMDQNEWMYNDPAFPQLNMPTNSNVSMSSQDGMGFPTNGVPGESSGSEMNWSDWDEMMRDLPMGTEQMSGFGGAMNGGGTGSVMGGMTNWW